MTGCTRSSAMRPRSCAAGACQAASLAAQRLRPLHRYAPKELRADGESVQRLSLLNTWRESPFYSERERAALAWTEAVTLVAESRVPDDVYDEARKQLSEEELV